MMLCPIPPTRSRCWFYHQSSASVAVPSTLSSLSSVSFIGNAVLLCCISVQRSHVCCHFVDFCPFSVRVRSLIMLLYVWCRAPLSLTLMLVRAVSCLPLLRFFDEFPGDKIKYFCGCMEPFMNSGTWIEKSWITPKRFPMQGRKRRHRFAIQDGQISHQGTVRRGKQYRS
jgi:hypothetical protein